MCSFTVCCSVCCSVCQYACEIPNDSQQPSATRSRYVCRVAAVMCAVLQCCHVLQCATLCCSVLQCVGLLPTTHELPPVTHSRNMCNVAVCCSVQHCVAVCCNEFVDYQRLTNCLLRLIVVIMQGHFESRPVFCRMHCSVCSNVCCSVRVAEREETRIKRKERRRVIHICI